MKRNELSISKRIVKSQLLTHRQIAPNTEAH